MRKIVFMMAMACVTANVSAENWTVVSPGGQVSISIKLSDLAGTADFPKGARLYYRVEHGAAGSRSVIVNDSPLGLQLQGQDFLNGLVFDSATQPKLIEESYEMLHGKRRQCHNRAQQVTLALHNANGQKIELDIRAYDDGAAFRYRLPGSGNAQCVVTAEETGFSIPLDAKVWMAPSDKATTYSPAYETYYENGIAVGTPAPLGLGWSFPALFRTASGCWGLITESGVNPSFCGTRLSSTAPKGVYRISFPDPAEGNGHGHVNPSAKLPWEMPWRVIIVGGSLGGIVESTLVTDVAEASRVKDVSWVKPGRVAWSWWSDPPSPTDGAKQRKFVDFAAEMGWEYVLVDANWDLMDNGNIHDVLRYAKEKGVGILLWYNSGGPHNIVTEKPRDCLVYKEVRRFELDLLKKWGVKGIKVDFFQSDKQEVMEIYHGIMKDAADFQIMVNFHGCTLPRGWERTYPHLMSMEAVRGEECYIFDPKYPVKAPLQSTIIPFTRNAIGPMDYTPVTFTDNNNKRLTSAAHELALSVLFESGWVHFADKAESYLSLPDEPKEFLKHVPVTWDDTKFVAGEPGQFVILARRHGDTWYITGVNGQNEPREEVVKPGAWLGAGKYDLVLIGDGAAARTFASEKKAFEAGQEFKVKMLPYGGFAATLKAAK